MSTESPRKRLAEATPGRGKRRRERGIRRHRRIVFAMQQGHHEVLVPRGAVDEHG